MLFSITTPCPTFRNLFAKNNLVCNLGGSNISVKIRVWENYMEVYSAGEVGGVGTMRHGQHNHFHLPHLNINLHLHLHLHHANHHSHHNKHPDFYKYVPKGCVAVYVGREGEEKQQRFVIPVVFINHPLFEQLLKEAEEEYGFEYENGKITIPCPVADFQRVRDLIRDEHIDNHHHHHHGCFR